MWPASPLNHSPSMAPAAECRRAWSSSMRWSSPGNVHSAAATNICCCPRIPCSSALTPCSTDSGNGFRPQPPARLRHDSRSLVGVNRSPRRRAFQEVASWSSRPFRTTKATLQANRIHLEQRGYAPATINVRLAAVRRIAYEAADAGLLSPELVAGIRRVKGARRRLAQGSTSWPRTTCGAPAPVSATSPAANRIRSSFCSATSRSRRPSATLGASRSSGLQ
jgi:hypothetical protein